MSTSARSLKSAQSASQQQLQQPSRSKVQHTASGKASMIAEAIKQKLHVGHRDHDQENPPHSHRHGSTAGEPLLKNKLAEYTEAELNDYRQVFNMFDTDRSGSIALDELEHAMKNMGLDPRQEELEMIIDEVDHVGNHEIDFADFCGVMKKLSAKKKTWNDVVKECFVVFDRVNPFVTFLKHKLQGESGHITKRDFQYILRELGDISDDNVIEEIFTEADVDGNGLIDYDEFTFMVKNYMTDEDIL